MRRRKVKIAKGEAPYLSSKAKATLKRDKIASIVLVLVVVACIAITIAARLNK